MYDLNGDGFISREEMFQLLKNCLVKQPAEEDPDEGVKELVEITLKKMVNIFSEFQSSFLTKDMDKDSKLSKGDFESSVQSEQLLLEAFGKCLPDRELSEVSSNCKEISELTFQFRVLSTTYSASETDAQS